MRILDVGSVSSVRSTTSTTSATTASSAQIAEEQSVESIQTMDRMHTEPQKQEEDQKVINDEMLEKSVDQANKTLSQYNRYIERSVHEKTKAIMYVMKDTKTDEVIREFPPKKIQDMIAKMWELAGLFVDEKA